MSRPPIPAEIRRAVLLESGHRCAIPKCKHTDVDIHHIIPWERCQKHEYANLIALCPNCHRMAHKGGIDKKSLQRYKEILVTSMQNLKISSFNYPITEAKRKIFEVDLKTPERCFDFEFPDFFSEDFIIASKNIEAWGIELLEYFREQIKDLDSQPELTEWQRTIYLTGRYHVARRDEHVLSICYTIDSINPGAAHGFRDTRVQNFLISPFRPLLLQDLIDSQQKLEDLSERIIQQLLEENPKFCPDWVRSGVTADEASLGTFIINDYDIEFIFPEYSIAAYAFGTPSVRISLYLLRDIITPSTLASISK